MNEENLIHINSLINMNKLTKFGESMKVKFNNLFKKEIKNNSESSVPYRSTLNKNGASNQRFTIEEDDDHKVFSYNLDNDDEFEEDEYVEEEDLDQEIYKKEIYKKEIYKKEKNNDDIIYNQPELKLDDDIPLDLESNIQTQCHLIYPKYSLLDLEGLCHVKCFKLKKKNQIFSMIGIGKEKLVEEKCFVLLDENFIYTLKDYKQNKIAQVGKYYNLKTLNNIDIKNLEKGRVLFSLVFVLNKDIDNYQSKIKEFYFENKEAYLFFDYLKMFIQILKIPLIFNSELKN